MDQTFRHWSFYIEEIVKTFFCNLLCKTVLAELPSSIRAQSLNETRSIEAAFVHSGLDTGPIVHGALGIDGELVLKRFVARNVRAITHVESQHW